MSAVVDKATQVIAWQKKARESRAAVKPLDAWSRAEGCDNPSEDVADGDERDLHRWCIDAGPDLAAFVVLVDEVTAGAIASHGHAEDSATVATLRALRERLGLDEKESHDRTR